MFVDSSFKDKLHAFFHNEFKTDAADAVFVDSSAIGTRKSVISVIEYRPILIAYSWNWAIQSMYDM